MASAVGAHTANPGLSLLNRTRAVSPAFAPKLLFFLMKHHLVSPRLGRIFLHRTKSINCKANC